MGNILGSNIINIKVILAVSAIIVLLAVKNSTTWIEIPLALLAGIVIFVLANDRLVDGAVIFPVTRIDGIVLILYLGYLVFLIAS